MDISVPLEIERVLVEEARRLGTTPELLAVDSLRERFMLSGTAKSSIPGQGTLADFLKDHIGVLHSSEFVAGGARMSEESGKKFAAQCREKVHSMTQIELNEAKKHLTDLIETALGGEEVVITQNAQPVLKLVRVAAPKARRKAGSAKGLSTMSDDFDAPLEEFQEYL